MLPYISFNFRSENLVVYNDNIEELMKFLIVITCIIDFVLRLKGEISCQSFKKKSRFHSS